MIGWVDERLRAAGRVRTGELTLVRERSWATVHSAPTDQGTVWLKLTPPGAATEVRLYELLARIVPEHVLVPLGTDAEHGRLLLPDGGETVRERAGGDDDAEIAGLAGAYPVYARLQRALAPHADALVAIGVPDMRPPVMPRRLDEALAAVTPYAARHGEQSTLDALHRLRDTYAGWCAELAASGVPDSIDHNDLHAANILVDGAGVRFYDWGDAVVAHPFACLLPVTANLPAAVADRVVDPYLAQFGDPARLRPVAELAQRVALVARTLVWHAALGPDPLHHEHAAAPLQWLARLLRAAA